MKNSPRVPAPTSRSSLSASRCRSPSSRPGLGASRPCCYVTHSSTEDAKVAEIALVGYPGDLNVGDARAGGTIMAPGNEDLHRRFLSLHHRFDGAINSIPHPAG